jgi:two-component system, LytTR family, response regulator LytT
MRALLIEDEPSAMDRMKQMLLQIDESVEIVGECDSVDSAVQWLNGNPVPDVIFTDVQLGDGNCFEIFDHSTIGCPVVFITAYNEHALEAFRVNATDYLLKPLKKEELERAYTKLVKQSSVQLNNIDYNKLAKAILTEQSKFDRRYLIRYGEQIRTVTSEDIAYIYTTQKAVFLVTHAGKEYPVDKSLEMLEKELDPKKFFRINRQFIVNIRSIGNMHTVSKSRVQLDLNPPFHGEDVIVSTEKSPIFKDWLGGE